MRPSDVTPAAAISIRCLGDLAFSRPEPDYMLGLPPADLVVGNIETVLTDERLEPANKLVHLRAPTSTATAYAQSLGVTIATIANNHMFDFGPAGMRSTRAALTAAGIAVVGAGDDVTEAAASHVVDCNGVRVAVGGAACTLPYGSVAGVSRPGCWPVRIDCCAETDVGMQLEQPGSAPFLHTRAREEDVAGLRARLREMRATADVTLLNLHWGVHPAWLTPFHGPLAGYQRDLICRLKDDGPDVVLGHHPHVLHGIEQVNRTTVLYSTGNFVFQPWVVGENALFAEVDESVKSAVPYPPYVDLADERVWETATFTLRLVCTEGRYRVESCTVVPYQLNRATGLAEPVTDEPTAERVLAPVLAQTRAWDAAGVVEIGAADSEQTTCGRTIRMLPPAEHPAAADGIGL